MNVRSATTADIDTLIELANGVVDENRWVTPEPGDPRFSRAYWVASLSDSAGTVFVANDGDRVVGLVRLTRHEGNHHLGMMVDKAHRRRGHGKALLDAAIQWARERSIRELYLSVYAHNAAARELYRSSGFREIQVLPGHCVRSSGEVWNAVLMVRALS